MCNCGCEFIIFLDLQCARNAHYDTKFPKKRAFPRLMYLNRQYLCTDRSLPWRSWWKAQKFL